MVADKLYVSTAFTAKGNEAFGGYQGATVDPVSTAFTAKGNEAR